MQISSLKQNKAFIKVLSKYSDFADIFSEKEAFVLLEQIELNKNGIDLKGDKQLPFEPIYSLALIELEILKFYIKTYLKTRFI